MSYQWKLISERKKGKFAKCWLAATLSSKAFQKKYRASTIDDINVCQMCDHIKIIIERNNEATHGKGSLFVLYFSSQLVYGVVKIWSYQTSNLDKNSINFEKLLLYKEFNKGNEEKYEKVIEPLDVSATSSAQLHKDVNLLSEEFDIEIKLRNKMNADACLEFGALTEKEVAFIDAADIDISLEMFERTHIRNPYIDNGLDISFGYEKMLQSTEVSNIDAYETQKTISISHIHDDVLGTVQEHQIKFTKTTLPEITIQDIESRKTDVLTPQKRQSNEEKHIETPSKRRRNEPDTDQVAIAPIPETAVASTSAIDRPLELPQNLELPEINSLEMERKLKKKKVFVDKNKKLNYETIKKWINNVNITTMPLSIPNVSIPMSNILFKQPSTSFITRHEKKWNNSLSALFHMHTVTKYVQETMPMEYEELLDKSTEFTRFEDGSHKTEGLSEFSILGKTLESSAHTKSAATELKDISILQKESYKEKSIYSPQQEIAPPNIEEVDLQNLVDNFELLNTKQPTHRDLKVHKEEKEEYQETYKLSQSCALTRQELLALLEIHWSNSEMVQFADVIQPDCYNKNDAASCFIYLLELHKEKKITLEQAMPYDILWIKKYSQ